MSYQFHSRRDLGIMRVKMWRALVLFIFLISCTIFDFISASEESKVVVLADGAVKGDKYWDGEFFEFYGVPYAKAPTGRDRYQAPLPPEPWQGLLDASHKKTVCIQSYTTRDEEDSTLVDGEEDCLVMNILVPKVASEQNLVPVVVYIHSGAFSGGNGNMANLYYVARHDVIAISFNYRLGALGFACLGNKEIPGNAALKDQVAALRWIQKNIKKFGGDPTKVTLAGFSVGATMAELLSFSKATTGLFNRLILDSGSALAPFAINRDPIATAANIAFSLGYNQTVTLDSLTEFYLNANTSDLADKSVNYHLKNSTFGFAPCIENILEDIEPIITESPLETLKKGRNNDVAVLIGFADQEGLSRSIKFGTWREDMNEDFSEFIPVDIKFDDVKTKDKVIDEIKKYYFDNKPVNAETLQKYVDYFSDTMFKYNILKSAKLHAATSKKPVYLYEFSYTGKLNIEHNYMDRIKGASHRDQTAYVLDFFGHTLNYKDLDTRERMTTMWTDFVKYENPTAFESHLINVKWLPYTNSKRHFMEINKKLQIKTSLFENSYNFWDKIYKKYYWSPTPATFDESKFIKIEKDAVDEKESPNGKKSRKEKIPVIKPEILKENIESEEKDTLKKKDEPKETIPDVDSKKEISKSEETRDKKDNPSNKKTLNQKDDVKVKDATVVNTVNKQQENLVPKNINDPIKQKQSKSQDSKKETSAPQKNNTVLEKNTIKESDSINNKSTEKPETSAKEKDATKVKDTLNQKDIPEEESKENSTKRKNASKVKDTKKATDSIDENGDSVKVNDPKNIIKQNDNANENQILNKNYESGNKNADQKETSKQKNVKKETKTSKQKGTSKDVNTATNENDPPKDKKTPLQNNTPKKSETMKEIKA